MDDAIVVCPSCGNDVRFPDIRETVPGNRMESTVYCPWERCNHEWTVHTSALDLKAEKVGEDRRK
jgi:hypothetical protein